MLRPTAKTLAHMRPPPQTPSLAEPVPGQARPADARSRSPGGAGAGRRVFGFPRPQPVTPDSGGLQRWQTRPACPGAVQSRRRPHAPARAHDRPRQLTAQPSLESHGDPQTSPPRVALAVGPTLTAGRTDARGAGGLSCSGGTQLRGAPGPGSGSVPVTHTPSHADVPPSGRGGGPARLAGW